MTAFRGSIQRLNISGSPPYQSGNYYIGSLGPGITNVTATNTNTIGAAADSTTLYAILVNVNQPVIITKVGILTSSSNASSGASFKGGIYSVGSDGKPFTLLGSSTAGTSVTNSATSTGFDVTLDTPTLVPAGAFFLSILPTATVTAMRVATYNSIGAWAGRAGCTTAAKVYGISGYDAAGFTATTSYAAGLPASPTWAAYNNAATNLPAIHYVVQ